MFFLQAHSIDESVASVGLFRLGHKNARCLKEVYITGPEGNELL